MVIKATRLQAWAPARVGRRPPPPLKLKKKVFWLYWGPFCYVFHHVGAFFKLAPPPTKISAGAHDCKEGSRACSPEICLCHRSLVSSGHVLLRFCLKNDKNNDKL